MLLLNLTKEEFFAGFGCVCVFIWIYCQTVYSQYNFLYFKAGGNVNILMLRQCYFKISMLRKLSNYANNEKVPSCLKKIKKF